MKYIVYLTINFKSKINGKYKIYIGVHKTENPDIFDGYLGCGVYEQQISTYKYPKTPFQCAVKKYGPAAFKRITLFEFDSPEEAYKKEEDLVTTEFIKQSHVYNVVVGGICNNNGIPLYQFDLDGNLVKKWEYSKDAFEFYGYPATKFHAPIYGKYKFLNSYWSYSECININDCITKESQTVYLYNKDGKLLQEFSSQSECAKFLNTTCANINKNIKLESLCQKQYYISYKLTDCFKPKPRLQYKNLTYYIYQEHKFIGKFIGKEIMPILNLYSWSKISDIFRYYNNWYKNFYISLQEETTIPEKPTSHGNSIRVDIFTKYGNFIETLNSIKEVKEKYNLRSSDLKNIMLGDKYCKDYIFKYHKQ